MASEEGMKMKMAEQDEAENTAEEGDFDADSKVVTTERENGADVDDMELPESATMTDAARAEVGTFAEDLETAVMAGEERVAENGASDQAAAKSESAEEGGDEEERIDSEKLMRFAANPMFAHFARGRRDGVAKICRDFEAMLAAGGYSDCGDVGMTAKMTPSVGAATPDMALSDRQRELARAAGMSYREYYELVRVLPDRMPKSNETYKQKMP